MRRPPRDDFKRANQLAPGVQWIEGNRTRQARGAAAKLKGVEQLGYPTKAGRPSGRQSDPPALPGRCYGYVRASPVVQAEQGQPRRRPRRQSTWAATSPAACQAGLHHPVRCGRCRARPDRERIAEVERGQRQRRRYLGGTAPWRYCVGDAGELLPATQTGCAKPASSHQGEEDPGRDRAASSKSSGCSSRLSKSGGSWGHELCRLNALALRSALVRWAGQPVDRAKWAPVAAF